MDEPLLSSQVSTSPKPTDQTDLSSYYKSKPQNSIKGLLNSFRHHDNSSQNGSDTIMASNTTKTQTSLFPTVKESNSNTLSVEPGSKLNEKQSFSKSIPVNQDPALNSINRVNCQQENRPMDHIDSTSSVEGMHANAPIKASEGYLATCGMCQSRLLFPLGIFQVACGRCGSINNFNYNALPPCCNKAFMMCPSCKGNILYTIGATHFQCTCGTLIVIPQPLYYLPFFGNQNPNQENNTKHEMNSKYDTQTSVNNNSLLNNNTIPNNNNMNNNNMNNNTENHDLLSTIPPLLRTDNLPINNVSTRSDNIDISQNQCGINSMTSIPKPLPSEASFHLESLPEENEIDIDNSLNLNSSLHNAPSIYTSNQNINTQSNPLSCQPTSDSSSVSKNNINSTSMNTALQKELNHQNSSIMGESFGSITIPMLHTSSHSSVHLPTPISQQNSQSLYTSASHINSVSPSPSLTSGFQSVNDSLPSHTLPNSVSQKASVPLDNSQLTINNSIQSHSSTSYAPSIKNNISLSQNKSNLNTVPSTEIDSDGNEYEIVEEVIEDYTPSPVPEKA